MDHDPRFTVGLVLDVARVLEEHGYYWDSTGQIDELQTHLFHLLHGDPSKQCEGGTR